MITCRDDQGPTFAERVSQRGLGCSGATVGANPETPGARLAGWGAYPWPFPGRPPKHDLSTWTVTDDWPDPVPVTQAEIEVFERWFGDLFDELFDPDN